MKNHTGWWGEPRAGIEIGRGKVGALAMILLIGCAPTETLYDAHRVASQHEAGSVHIAVLSVAPWQEYMGSLQPNFNLSEEAALDQVVPSTRGLEESVVNAMTASTGASVASLRGPQEGAQRTTQTTSEALEDGSERTTETITESRDENPDLAVRDTRPPDVIVQRPSARPPARDPSLEVAPDMDPLLRYWAATALFQEVQLLNRYVKDAAIREGFDPYVVRLQVSLMPQARGEPYDAYCTVSFFARSPADDGGSDGTRGLGASRIPLRGIGDVAPPATGRLTPQIIPLMVTDNLEATLQSRSMENIRQMALALYFVSNSVGGSANLDRFSDHFQRVFGRDLNSLLTVGRVSDNTLRVRLGAMQQGSSDYAMIPRTHSITVLVMVPSGGPRTLEAVARTTMVDAVTGKPLPNRPASELDSQIRAIQENYSLQNVDLATIKTWLNLAQSNDQRRFFRQLEEDLGENHDARAYGKALWVDLVELMVGSQYSATEFDLPRPPDLAPAGQDSLFPTQTAMVVDDGRSAATAVLKGARFSDPSDLLAILAIRSAGREFPILADEIAMDPTTGEVRIRFPSPLAWGLAESARVAGNLRLRVFLFDHTEQFEALYLARPDGK